MHMAERFLLVCCHCHKGISSRLLYLPSWAPQRPLLLSLAADQGEAASVKAPLVATKHHWSAMFCQCQELFEAGTFLMPGFFLFRLQVCNIKKTSRGLFFFISSFVLSLKRKPAAAEHPWNHQPRSTSGWAWEALFLAFRSASKAEEIMLEYELNS